MNVIHMLIILCFRTVYTWKGRPDLPEPFFFVFFRFYACFFLKKEYTGCCAAAMPRNAGQIWTADNDVMEMRIVALSFFTRSRACLKNHSRNLHAPICGIFCPNSVVVAHYDALICAKSSTNCDAHLAESLFQTRSSGISGEVRRRKGE